MDDNNIYALVNAFKNGEIDRYNYQNELARLHAYGEMSDGLFDYLNDEAVAMGYVEER